MITKGYIRAVFLIAWGYVLLLLDFSFGTLNLLPDWAGYLLIVSALPAVAQQQPEAKLLRPLGLALAGWDGVIWTLAIFGIQLNLQIVPIIISAINMYFHFQLLTNLAETAKACAPKYARRLWWIRTIQVLMIAVMALVNLVGIPVPLQESLGLIGSALLLIFVIYILGTMFGYAAALDKVDLPVFVRQALDLLGKKGHRAYIVGGCVRDYLMSRAPSDWDICTDAKPEEIKEAFAGYKTIDTGIAHGTVTVMIEGEPVEITTYRVDGPYADGRHPESVAFTDKIEEDLARRDFTINAIAYHPEYGFVDPFYGKEDIGYGEIRCVGEPAQRFSEDALRIMRGLRFAAVLGFSLGEATGKAMEYCCELVDKVSRERVNVELSKLLLGADVDRVMERYGGMLQRIVPGLSPVPVSHLPQSLSIRLATVFPVDTEEHLRTLKYSSQTVREAAALNRLSAEEPPLDDIGMKKVLAAEGEELAKLYFAMIGKSAELKKVFASGECWSLKDLAVSGDDLISAGVEPGHNIGQLLTEMLELVIEEKLDNDREALLKYIVERR